MIELRLGVRWVLRDWRSGEVGLPVAALALAAAAVATVDFFADRVQRALTGSAAELLAADAAIEWSEPPRADWEEAARTAGLRTARTLSFPSVVLHGDTTQLVQIKAVGDGYPLRGRLRSSPDPATLEASEAGALPAGEAWGEARLFAQLGVAPGTAIEVGELRLPLARVVTEEPDRGGDLLQFAPRVLMHLDDVPRTGLVGPASRVSHRLLLAGSADDLARYAASLKPLLPKGAEGLDASRARPELNAALERGTKFLALAAATVVVLAGAAAMLAARRFVDRQTDAAAVLRCLGLSSRGLLLLFVTRLLFLAGAATVLGSLLGLGAQAALGALVGRWFAAELPPPSLGPLLDAAVATLLVLAATVLPPLVRLRRTPPARVLRHDLGPPPGSEWLAIGLAVAALGVFLTWRMDDFELGMRALAGVVATIGVLAIAVRGLIRLLDPIRLHGHTAWRHGIAAVARHPTLALVQTVGFGLGIMALLLLSVVRTDLMAAWRDKLPADAPNYFLINIQPNEHEQLEALLAERGVRHSGVLPMIRGRLLEIGDRAVNPGSYSSARAQRLASREFNLSFGTELQADNRIVAGRWWDADTRAAAFSVEAGIAETLGIALGDRLTFQISGQSVEGTVESLRQVQWDSFNANFFVIGTPALLRSQPATYITSFHLPADRLTLLADLARHFPSVTVIDVGGVLSQVRAMIERAALALEYVFAFTLAAGVIVLLAAVQASREVRAREIAVLRTLGASRRYLYAGLAVEFALIGLLAGTVAATGAMATGWLVSEAVFSLPWSLNPWLLPTGALLGALGVGAAGLLAVRRLVDVPPVVVLRSA
jgi:putative ABC transport system permease protein